MRNRILRLIKFLRREEKASIKFLFTNKIAQEIKFRTKLYLKKWHLVIIILYSIFSIVASVYYSFGFLFFLPILSILLILSKRKYSKNTNSKYRSQINSLYKRIELLLKKYDPNVVSIILSNDVSIGMDESIIHEMFNITYEEKIDGDYSKWHVGRGIKNTLNDTSDYIVIKNKKVDTFKISTKSSYKDIILNESTGIISFKKDGKYIEIYSD